MKEWHDRMGALYTLAERIDERVERIDVRTEAHTGQLNNIAGLKDETARIANALERIGERHANRMFAMSLGGLCLLTAIIFILISAYTKTPISVGGSDKGVSLSTGGR